MSTHPSCLPRTNPSYCLPRLVCLLSLKTCPNTRTIYLSQIPEKCVTIVDKIVCNDVVIYRDNSLSCLSSLFTHKQGDDVNCTAAAFKGHWTPVPLGQHLVLFSAEKIELSIHCGLARPKRNNYSAARYLNSILVVKSSLTNGLSKCQTSSCPQKALSPDRIMGTSSEKTLTKTIYSNPESASSAKQESIVHLKRSKNRRTKLTT